MGPTWSSAWNSPVFKKTQFRELEFLRQDVPGGGRRTADVDRRCSIGRSEAQYSGSGQKGEKFDRWIPGWRGSESCPDQAQREGAVVKLLWLFCQKVDDQSNAPEEATRTSTDEKGVRWVNKSIENNWDRAGYWRSRFPACVKLTALVRSASYATYVTLVSAPDGRAKTRNEE